MLSRVDINSSNSQIANYEFCKARLANNSNWTSWQKSPNFGPKLPFSVMIKWLVKTLGQKCHNECGTLRIMDGLLSKLAFVRQWMTVFAEHAKENSAILGNLSRISDSLRSRQLGAPIREFESKSNSRHSRSDQLECHPWSGLHGGKQNSTKCFSQKLIAKPTILPIGLSCQDRRLRLVGDADGETIAGRPRRGGGSRRRVGHPARGP